MPTATKRLSGRKPTVRALSEELKRLRLRVDELEDLRDLNSAIARNQGKAGIPWDRVKGLLKTD